MTSFPDGPHGAVGLAMYLQWRSRRPSNAPYVTCGLTGPVLVLECLSSERRDLMREARVRGEHFEYLDRLYPGASVPRGPSECLEFEQRCWWLGISLRQGASLREVNRKHGLLWP